MSEAVTKPDIVVGVDGSDESFAALKWALEEASLTGQSVNAVFGWTHSWDMGTGQRRGLGQGPPRYCQRAACVGRQGRCRHRLRSGESEAHLGEGLRYFGPAADRP